MTFIYNKVEIMHKYQNPKPLAVTHQPAAVVRRVEKWGDAVEKATELGLGLFAGPSLKHIIKYKANLLHYNLMVFQ